jgi:hypothetical protein
MTVVEVVVGGGDVGVVELVGASPAKVVDGVVVEGLAIDELGAIDVVESASQAARPSAATTNHLQAGVERPLPTTIPS